MEKGRTMQWNTDRLLYSKCLFFSTYVEKNNYFSTIAHSMYCISIGHMSSAVTFVHFYALGCCCSNLKRNRYGLVYILTYTHTHAHIYEKKKIYGLYIYVYVYIMYTHTHTHMMIKSKMYYTQAIEIFIVLMVSIKFHTYFDFLLWCNFLLKLV